MIKDIANDLKQLKILLQLKEIDKAEIELDKILTEVYIARKNNTKCWHCGCKIPYNEAGLLCEECHMEFGQSLSKDL